MRISLTRLIQLHFFAQILVVVSPALSEHLAVSNKDNPVYELLADTEVIWEAAPAAKAVLLVIHGCNHGAVDWWHNSTRCPTCQGLPEEIRIRRAAQARGYTVVAVSSQDRAGAARRCWQTYPWPPENSVDVVKTVEAMKTLIKREGWEKLPLYALGASSGGAFVINLAFRLRLQAVCSIIAGIPAKRLSESDPTDLDTGATWQYPPTIFVHMVKDERTDAEVASNMAVLRDKDVPVAEETIQALPLTPTFFSDRIEEFTPDFSAALFNAFKDGGFLDEQGFQLQNPRIKEGRWRKHLLKHVPGMEHVRLKNDESPLLEELKMAWAEHEMASDKMREILDFFDKHRGL